MNSNACSAMPQQLSLITSEDSSSEKCTKASELEWVKPDTLGLNKESKHILLEIRIFAYMVGGKECCSASPRLRVWRTMK